MALLPILTALCAALLLLCGILAMGLFSSANHFVAKDRTVIVTGGSQGLGLCVAKQLASKGANVVIVARDQSKLQDAHRQISESAVSSSQRFLHLSYDLCSPKSAPAILEEVTAWNNGHNADILFSCAGYCEPGFFASTSLDTHRSQMETIYWSCAYMAHAMLNNWLTTRSEADAGDKRPRHIIFTSSILAFLPLAGYAPYTPAKAAMRSLADTLAQEVAVYNGARQGRADSPADIKIHTIFPMGILSPGYDNEQKLKPELTMMLEKDDKPQTPDEVARISIERLEAGDSMITTQFLGHVLRGVGMGSSVRNGVLDMLWNLVGSVAIIFVTSEIMAKCRKWGKNEGMSRAR